MLHRCTSLLSSTLPGWIGSSLNICVGPESKKRWSAKLHEAPTSPKEYQHESHPRLTLMRQSAAILDEDRLFQGSYEESRHIYSGARTTRSKAASKIQENAKCKSIMSVLTAACEHHTMATIKWKLPVLRSFKSMHIGRSSNSMISHWCFGLPVTQSPTPMVNVVAGFLHSLQF